MRGFVRGAVGLGTAAALLVGAVAVAPVASAAQQDGSINTQSDPGSGLAPDPGAAITSVQQADGKVVIGGYFLTYNGAAAHAIARVNPDGSLDSTFAAGTGFGNGSVSALAIQPNGQILAGGQFFDYDGVARAFLVRINPDGSVDPDFNNGAGFNHQVSALAVLPDGDILVAGDFDTYNDEPVGPMVRLNSDGSLDRAFKAEGGIEGASVQTIAPQPDGDIMIGGNFLNYGSSGANSIARMKRNGAVDPSFKGGSGFHDPMGAPAGLVQRITSIGNDLLVVGNFDRYRGNPASSIIRLNQDGSVDQSLNTGSGFDGQINQATLQPNGLIVAIGNFNAYRDQAVHGIIRLYPSGDVDRTFDSGTGFDSSVSTMQLLPTGKAVIGGFFSMFADVARNGIAGVNVYDASSKVQQPQKACKDIFPKRIKRSGDTVVLNKACRTNAGFWIKPRIVGKKLRGDVRPLYRVIHGKNGKVTIRTYGTRLDLRITYKAPATSDYLSFYKTRVYHT